MVENNGRNNNLFLRRIGTDNGEISRLKIAEQLPWKIPKKPYQVQIMINGKLEFGWSLDREDIAHELAQEMRQAGEAFFTPNNRQIMNERRLSLFWQSKDKEVKTTDGRLET
jgi:hypothetical protein